MIRKVLIGTYVAAGIFAGCATAPLPQDMCSWIADENNCLQRFALDVGERCGGPFVPPKDPASVTVGTFSTREKLDVCVKSEGGQVIFDPPLDLSAFPLTSVSFKLLDDQAAPCGSGAFESSKTFAIAIEPALTETPEDPITGGVFSVTASVDTEATYDVACPGGVETHHFNSLLLAKCPTRIPFQPTAVLESSPGVPEVNTQPAKPGFVRFRVNYPPVDVDEANASPRVVEYFNCMIPAPPPPCADGVRNGTETAIDCGGSCVAKGLTCADGQACLEATDCKSGKCEVETQTGIRKCRP